MGPTKRLIQITTRTNEEKTELGQKIHEQLKGNKDYINNNIVLNIDDDCLIMLAIFNECKEMPKIVIE